MNETFEMRLLKTAKALKLTTTELRAWIENYGRAFGIAVGEILERMYQSFVISTDSLIEEKRRVFHEYVSGDILPLHVDDGGNSGAGTNDPKLRNDGAHGSTILVWSGCRFHICRVVHWDLSRG